MGLLDVAFENVQITPEKLLNEGFVQARIYASGAKLNKYSRLLSYCDGMFYFDISFYMDLHPDDHWTIRLDIRNHHRMIETWSGNKWVNKGMAIAGALKSRPIWDMQELQMMLTKEWIKAWLTDLVADGKLQFEYSEMFNTY